MPENIFYINGAFVAASQAVIPVDDLIVLRGYGVFDFLRTYNRIPFHLDVHLDRLANSAALIGLNLRWSKDELTGIVIETLERNPHLPECNIRIVVTGGSSHDNLSPSPEPRLLVMVSERPAPPATWYSDGVKVVTKRVKRYIPDAKSTDYLPAVIAKREAEAASAVETIYVDGNDRILEGTTTNFFAVINGQIVTPGTDILNGITRMVLLDILDGKLAIEQRDVEASEIPSFTEAFITASNKEVVPVTKIDDHTVGNGTPGPITQQVMTEFRAYTDMYGRRQG